MPTHGFPPARERRFQIGGINRAEALRPTISLLLLQLDHPRPAIRPRKTLERALHQRRHHRGRRFLPADVAHGDVEQALAVARRLDRDLHLAVEAVLFLHVVGRHRTPERIVERAVPAGPAPEAAAPAEVAEARRIRRVGRRERRVDHLGRHIDGRETHRHLQCRRLRRLVEAEAGHLAAHQVLVALQFERVVLRRRRFEGVALVGQLGRPLVECGDVAADRGRAAA